MSGTEASKRLMRLHTENPLMSGSSAASRIRSGRLARQRSTAGSPAERAVTWNPAGPKARRTDSATSGSDSMSSNSRPICIDAIADREAEEGWYLPHVRARLHNGLDLLVAPRATAPVVALQCWVAVGSADERPGEEGLAHIHEHMAFKGTARRRPGELARRVEARG